MARESVATPTLLTYEQYRDLAEMEGVIRELDEGRVIEMAHACFLHGAVQAKAARLLGNHIDEKMLDFALSQNTSFKLAPDIERAPDPCAVRRSKLEVMTRVQGVLQGCSDLAVEVVSDSDTAADLDRKADQYLKAGATAVWVLYPETRKVLVRRRSGEGRLLTTGQVLEEPDLFPGLQIPVDSLFNV